MKAIRVVLLCWLIAAIVTVALTKLFHLSVVPAALFGTVLGYAAVGFGTYVAVKRGWF